MEAPHVDGEHDWETIEFRGVSEGECFEPVAFVSFEASSSGICEGVDLP